MYRYISRVLCLLIGEILKCVETESENAILLMIFFLSFVCPRRLEFYTTHPVIGHENYSHYSDTA